MADAHAPCSRIETRFPATDATPETVRQLATESGRAVVVIEATTWIDAAPTTGVQTFATPGCQLFTQGLGTARRTGANGATATATPPGARRTADGSPGPAGVETPRIALISASSNRKGHL